MDITCVTDNLREALHLAEKNAGKHTTLPVLSAVLFQAEAGKIRLSATNLETGVEMAVQGKITKEGTLALPARIMSLYIGNLRDPHVRLVAEGNNVVITSKTGKTTIKGFMSDDFPLLPRIKEEYIVSFPSHELREALSRVVIAASLSEIKPEIASVYFILSQKEAVLVATDSFRLAEKILYGAFAPSPFSGSFLLPGKSATELVRILEKREGIVQLALTKGQFACHTPSMRMVSRLTEGTFPDYKRIIPTKFSTECTITRSDFLDALRVAGLFIGKLYDIAFDIEPKKGVVVIHSSHGDIGEQVAEIPVHVRGEPLSIHFNYRYIMDGVNHITSNELFWGFGSAAGPLVMRGGGDPSYAYVVMPMKV